MKPAFVRDLGEQGADFRSGSLHACIQGQRQHPYPGAVGQISQSGAALTPDEQFQRDLETLHRIEQQLGCDVDFFQCMATLERGRVQS